MLSENVRRKPEMFTNSPLLNKEPETGLKTLRKLNDEVQSLEQQVFGESKNIHDDETLKGNLSEDLYNNYVSETHNYIQNLKMEKQIKDKIEQARKLEAILGIEGTQPYGQHNNEWWRNEQNADGYISYLTEQVNTLLEPKEEINTEIKRQETEVEVHTHKVDNKIYELQDQKDPESEERKSFDKYQRIFDIKTSTDKTMVDSNNQEDLINLSKPKYNQNKDINNNTSKLIAEMDAAVDGFNQCKDATGYYADKIGVLARKITALNKINVNEERSRSVSPVKPPLQLFQFNLNVITCNNNSYNILNTKDTQILKRKAEDEIINSQLSQKNSFQEKVDNKMEGVDKTLENGAHYYSQGLKKMNHYGLNPPVFTDKNKNIEEEHDRGCCKCTIF